MDKTKLVNKLYIFINLLSNVKNRLPHMLNGAAFSSTQKARFDQNLTILSAFRNLHKLLHFTPPMNQHVLTSCIDLYHHPSFTQLPETGKKKLLLNALKDCDDDVILNLNYATGIVSEMIIMVIHKYAFKISDLIKNDLFYKNDTEDAADTSAIKLLLIQYLKQTTNTDNVRHKSYKEILLISKKSCLNIDSKLFERVDHKLKYILTLLYGMECTFMLKLFRTFGIILNKYKRYFKLIKLYEKELQNVCKLKLKYVPSLFQQNYDVKKHSNSEIQQCDKKKDINQLFLDIHHIYYTKLQTILSNRDKSIDVIKFATRFCNKIHKNTFKTIIRLISIINDVDTNIMNPKLTLLTNKKLSQQPILKISVKNQKKKL